MGKWLIDIGATLTQTENEPIGIWSINMGAVLTQTELTQL